MLFFDTNKKSLRLMIIALSLCILISGCTYVPHKGFVYARSVKNEGPLATMEKEPVLPVDNALYFPRIVVDRVGYLTDSEKNIIFLLDSDMPENLDEESSVFRVVDSETGEEALEGMIAGNSHFIRDENAGYRVVMPALKKLDTPGTYYIENSLLGRSHAFALGDDIYNEITEELMSVIESAQWNITDASDVREAVLTLTLAMESFELFPEVFAGDGDGNKIPDLMDIITRQILKLLEAMEKREGLDIEAKNSVLLGAAFAKYSYVYRQYDEAGARISLQAADAIWGEETEGAVQAVLPDDLAYMAVTELYRASGEEKYREQLDRFIEKYYRNNGSFTLYEYLGHITYLSTGRLEVDKEYCAAIMKRLLSLAENIAASAKGQIYRNTVYNSFGYGKNDGDELDVILWNGAVMSVVDAIIPNHEYDTLIENQLHYLGGANGENTNYLSGSLEQISPLRASQILLLLNLTLR